MVVVTVNGEQPMNVQAGGTVDPAGGERVPHNDHHQPGQQRFGVNPS